MNKTEHAKEAFNARHAGCAHPTPFGCKDQADIQTGKLETAQASTYDIQSKDESKGKAKSKSGVKSKSKSVRVRVRGTHEKKN